MKEDVAIFLEMVRQCVAEHRDATCELRLTADGGRLITAQLRSVPIKVVVEGMGGETATFCKTAIADITGRKEMEEAIRQSRAFLQTVIDAMPEALSVISRDYRVVLANRSACRVCGETDLASDCLPCYRLIHRGGELPGPMRSVSVAAGRRHESPRQRGAGGATPRGGRRIMKSMPRRSSMTRGKSPTLSRPATTSAIASARNRRSSTIAICCGR